MAEIHTLPGSLDRLAIQIKRAIARRETGIGEWIEGSIELCLRLAEARLRCVANIEFGQWCTNNGFGKDILNMHDRAAAIAMGNDPQALRKCLEATERRSLQYIYKHDFPRFACISKTAKSPRKSSRRQNVTFDLDAAREVIRPLIEEDLPISRGKLADLLDVSVSVIHMADLMERGRLEGLAEAEIKPLSIDEMKPAMQNRYKAALRIATEQIRTQIKAQIDAEYVVYLKHWKARVARADRIIASHRGVMSHNDFRIVLAGLHPDHNTFAQASTAFELFKRLEPVLVRSETPELAGPPVPTTVAEMMARRKSPRTH